MNLRWSSDDTYLFSVGGLDCSTFQWKHVVKNEGSKELEGVLPFEGEPESVWSPNNFGRTMEDILLEINNDPVARGEILRNTQGSPVRSLTNESQPVPNNFGRPMEEAAAFVDQIEDPDDGMQVEDDVEED